MTSRFLVAFVATMTALLSVGGAAAATRADPNLHRWLVYTIARDGHGRKAIPLAAGLAAASSTTLSPDGRLLTYVGRTGNSEDVYVARADGSDARRVTASSFPKTRVRFSPDARSVSFENDNGNEFGESVYVAARSGAGERRIAEGRNASWSPSGQSLVYEGDFDAYNKPQAVFTVRPDGRGRRRLAAATAPRWSPDGRSIVAIGFATGRLVLLSPGGRLQRRLTGGFSPAWSGDGRRIAFLAGFGAKIGVFVVDRDGRHRRLLARTGGAGRPAVWSPDGRSVAFVRHVATGRGTDQIVVATLTSSVKQVTHEQPICLLSDVSWSRDGKRLVYDRYLYEALPAAT